LGDNASNLLLKIRVSIKGVLLSALVSVKIVPSVSAWVGRVFKRLANILQDLSRHTAPVPKSVRYSVNIMLIDEISKGR
jgi:hypothetical protein